MLEVTFCCFGFRRFSPNDLVDLFVGESFTRHKYHQVPHLENRID